MSKLKFNAEIEYLRAVAILLVLLDHLTGLLHWGPMVPPFYGADMRVIEILGHFSGWTGVDLFFCISGYVISLSFVELFDRTKARGKPWLAAEAFWIRRFFRIIPSAWLWLAVMILCSVYFNRSGTFFTPWRNIRGAIAIVAYVANFASLHGWLIPNGIYWSLALEEQFYFIFPMFLMLIAVPSRWKVLLALIGLQAIIPHRSDFDSILWLTRTDAMMWGCLIYQFTQKEAYRRLEARLFKWPWLVFVLSLWLVFLLGKMAAHIKPLSLIAVVSAALVLLASYQRGYVLGFPQPIKGILLWIGSRSYAIYLIHVPVFYMTYELWFRIAGKDLDATYTLPLCLTAFPLTCVLTEINYRLVEVPLRRKGAAIANRMVSEKPLLEPLQASKQG